MITYAGSSLGKAYASYRPVHHYRGLRGQVAVILGVIYRSYQAARAFSESGHYALGVYGSYRAHVLIIGNELITDGYGPSCGVRHYRRGYLLFGAESYVVYFLREGYGIGSAVYGHRDRRALFVVCGDGDLCGAGRNGVQHARLVHRHYVRVIAPPAHAAELLRVHAGVKACFSAHLQSGLGRQFDSAGSGHYLHGKAAAHATVRSHSDGGFAFRNTLDHAAGVHRRDLRVGGLVCIAGKHLVFPVVRLGCQGDGLALSEFEQRGGRILKAFLARAPQHIFKIEINFRQRSDYDHFTLAASARAGRRNGRSAFFDSVQRAVCIYGSDGVVIEREHDIAPVAFRLDARNKSVLGARGKRYAVRSEANCRDFVVHIYRAMGCSVVVCL